MGYIEGIDTIRGTDGSIIATFDDEEYDFYHIKTMEATASLTVDEIERIGTRTIGHKISTITFEGSATGYYGDPVIRRKLMEYISGGRYPKISIILTNNDPDTQSGEQTMVLDNVMFSELTLAKIDATTTMLEEDIDFTFERPIMLKEFNDGVPTGGSAV